MEDDSEDHGTRKSDSERSGGDATGGCASRLLEEDEERHQTTPSCEAPACGDESDEALEVRAAELDDEVEDSEDADDDGTRKSDSERSGGDATGGCASRRLSRGDERPVARLCGAAAGRDGAGDALEVGTAELEDEEDEEKDSSAELNLSALR